MREDALHDDVSCIDSDNFPQFPAVMTGKADINIDSCVKYGILMNVQSA